MLLGFFLISWLIYMTFFNNYMIVKVDNEVNIHILEATGGMELVFGKSGINDIYSIKNINYYNDLLKQILNIEDNYIVTGTDWIGPYIFKTKRGNMQSAHQFTGGWHGSNGDGTGNPTARCKNVKIYINGKEIKKTSFRFCETVTVQVTNEIMPCDDTAPAIEEIVSYKVTNNYQIKVSTAIRALKPIEIERYYGLQLIIPSGFNEILYEKDNRINAYYDTRVDQNNACDVLTNTIELKDEKTGHRLEARILEDSELGQFKYKAKDKPYAFATDYNKAYFNLVNGNILEMHSDQIIYWNGIYQLGK